MKITRTTDFELIARLNKPIHQLHVSLYPQYFAEYNFDEIRESFRQLVTNQNFVFLLLEENEEPLGYAWIEFKDYPQNAFTKLRKSVFVHQIGIVEEHKRRGCGSHLMDYIFGIAKNEGIDVVELDYWADNERAKSFYKKQGFLGYREFMYKRL